MASSRLTMDSQVLCHKRGHWRKPLDGPRKQAHLHSERCVSACDVWRGICGGTAFSVVTEFAVWVAARQLEWQVKCWKF